MNETLHVPRSEAVTCCHFSTGRHGVRSQRRAFQPELKLGFWLPRRPAANSHAYEALLLGVMAFAFPRLVAVSTQNTMRRRLANPDYGCCDGLGILAYGHFARDYRPMFGESDSQTLLKK